jgi:hypothetical protein
VLDLFELLPPMTLELMYRVRGTHINYPREQLAILLILTLTLDRSLSVVLLHDLNTSLLFLSDLREDRAWTLHTLNP